MKRAKGATLAEIVEAVGSLCLGQIFPKFLTIPPFGELHYCT